MEYNEIEQYLSGYIKIPNPQYAVMIKGKWGCGKTYLVKHLCKKWESPKSPNDNKNIILQPIYISLNGVSTCSAISLLIKRELHPILFSKGVTIARKVLFGTLDYMSKYAFDIDKDGNKDDLSSIFDSEAIIDILTKDNDSVKGEKILFFDDIERAKLPTDELFGYINNLVEHSKCKVIIICEEDKLRTICDNNKSIVKYDEFKEKLIGKTLHLEQDLHNIVIKMIEESNNKYLKDNNKLIADLFVASNVQNLRIIRQFITDFVIFITSFDIKKYNDELFAIFVKNVITYFTITYCEYKSGETSFNKYFQSFKFTGNDSDKDKIRFYEAKYNEIIFSNNIRHSESSISIENIIHYIENGNIPNLHYILSSNDILNNKPISDWEKLTRYAGLDSVTFFNALKNIKKLFYYGTIDYVSIVISIANTLLCLKQKSIIECSARYIEKKAKKHIDKIYEQYNEESSFYNRIDVHKNRSLWRFSGSIRCQEFINIINYATNKLDDYYKQENIRYCKEYWETINDYKAKNIGELLYKSPFAYTILFDQFNIFEKVDIKKTSKMVVNLAYDSKLFIKDYIECRYKNSPEMLNKELLFLSKFNKELIKSAKKCDRFSKSGTNEIIGAIEKLIKNKQK